MENEIDPNAGAADRGDLKREWLVPEMSVLSVPQATEHQIHVGGKDGFANCNS